MSESLTVLLRRIFGALLIGVTTGGVAALFLNLLDRATTLREASPLLLWTLPVVGLVIGFLYHRYGREFSRGHNLILDEIHDPQKTIPLIMAPSILIATIMSHLAGASVGREGTSIQMGGAIADQVARMWRFTVADRRKLLVCGMSAGFAAAIGTPWAGALFGMEALNKGRLRIVGWPESLVAAFAGYWTSHFFRHHFEFATGPFPAISPMNVVFVAIAGVLFGLLARLFILATHFTESLQARWIGYPPLRPFVGGLLVLVIYFGLETLKYAGLGWPVIVDSFSQTQSLEDPLWKLVVTALSVGSGFKGGEFTPLVFMGTTFGSALNDYLPLGLPLLASLGYVAVFAGAANTPLACSLMAAELFGWSILPYALLACVFSYLVSGERSIYKSQRYECRSRFKWLQ